MRSPLRWVLRLARVDEIAKIELVERVIAAWNAADPDALKAEGSDDFEFDLTRSDIPGESVSHHGPEALVRFAERWREALGPTQIVIEEMKVLPDGRLFVLIRHVGTGAQSGADVEAHHVHIHMFGDRKATRTEVFTDIEKGRAAAGLEP